MHVCILWNLYRLVLTFSTRRACHPDMAPVAGVSLASAALTRWSALLTWRRRSVILRAGFSGFCGLISELCGLCWWLADDKLVPWLGSLLLPDWRTCPGGSNMLHLNTLLNIVCRRMKILANAPGKEHARRPMPTARSLRRCLPICTAAACLVVSIIPSLIIVLVALNHVVWCWAPHCATDRRQESSGSSDADGFESESWAEKFVGSARSK
mmetsp:Transcript_17748/g.31712  ORF Transcript_17748/g.31712 Transcript_17748/m.31712 type:complete len:211 (+) Transcript_17748:132-764(+)